MYLQKMKHKERNYDVQTISLEDAVPASELHLDLALEKQERLSKELSKKMENKKLFDETEFALIYLQEYIHSSEESYNEVINMINGTGVSIMEIVEVRLEDDEPRTMLKDTGDKQNKNNNHTIIAFA